MKLEEVDEEEWKKFQEKVKEISRTEKTLGVNLFRVDFGFDGKDIWTKRAYCDSISEYPRACCFSISKYPRRIKKCKEDKIFYFLFYFLIFLSIFVSIITGIIISGIM